MILGGRKNKEGGKYVGKSKLTLSADGYICKTQINKKCIYVNILFIIIF